MSGTDCAVEPQNIAIYIGLKFRIKEEEELHYPCIENKGADHLRSHCAANLRL